MLKTTNFMIVETKKNKSVCEMSFLKSKYKMWIIIITMYYYK